MTAAPQGYIGGNFFNNQILSVQKLIQLLDAIIPLSAGLEKHLRSKIRRIDYQKGDIILAEGAVCQSIFYIESGLVRSFYRLNGKEVSNWFMKEGDICISVLSFLRQTPSYDILVALEPCLCWGITHGQLEETYKKYPAFNVHGRMISNEYYCRSEERIFAMRRQAPQDKYEQLMKQDPELVLRVPNSQMASYLDVGGRTYDMIRKVYREKMQSMARKNRRQAG
jgi:CRP-like cAMP-binding protein